MKNLIITVIVVFFTGYVLFYWGGTSKKAPAKNNIVNVPDEYTFFINWQEEHYQLDSLTKAEVKKSIYAFHDEYGSPDSSIVVDISHRGDSGIITFFNINKKRIFNRVSTSKHGDTLFVEPIGPRRSKGLPSLYGTINDVLFKRYFAYDID